MGSSRKYVFLYHQRHLIEGYPGCSGVARGRLPRAAHFWMGGTFDWGGTLGFKYLMRFESQFGVFKIIIYRFWRLADSS